MTGVVARQTISLRDAKGHVGKASFYYNYDNSTSGTSIPDAYTQVVAIATALAACSNGAIVGTTGLYGREWDLNVYGSTAQFQNAEDKARIVFVTNDVDATPITFGLVAIEIPMPKSAIFYADLETVNPGNSNILALKAAVLAADPSGGHAVAKGGELITDLAGGYRRRRRAQRKLTLWTKSPNLDESEE